MSNTYKVIIAAIAIAVLGAASIFIIGQNREENKGVTTQGSSSVLSSKSPTTSSSSQISISSTAVSSSSEPAKVVEAPKVETPKVEQPKVEVPAVDRGSNPNPVQDIPNVTKLSTDKSIYWQYIKDYLACPTKFYQPLNGGYIYEGLDQYQYLCIPQSEIDMCPSKTLVYGLDPLVGTSVITGNIWDKSKYLKVEKNKFYCANFYEVTGSVSLPQDNGYFQEYFPIGLDSKLPGYFSIPKSNLPKIISENTLGYMYKKVSFAAIPLESFSLSDQQYIAQNFTAK